MAAIPDFANTPRYKRLMQKLNRMTPDQQAIFSSFLVDSNMAELEMKKYLFAMRAGGAKKGRATRLALRKKGFTARTGQAKTRLSAEKEISGKRRVSGEAISRARIASNYGLQRRGIDERRSALPWQIGLGLANVGVGGGMGYANMKEGIRDAEETKKYRKKILARTPAISGYGGF